MNNELVCNLCRGVEPPKVCAGCDREFMPEEKKIGVKEDNEYFHEFCFLCSKCNNPIGTQKFVRTGPGTQTCNNCYQSRLQVKILNIFSGINSAENGLTKPITLIFELKNMDPL